MLLTKLTLLSFLISLTHAGPLQALSVALPPRQSPSFKNTNGIVIMCTEANWKGKCITLSVPTDDTCVQLQAPFLYNVSAIEPAFGTVCWRYTSANCSDICMSPSGCDMIVQFPGIADLKTDSNWDKKIGGLECRLDFNALGL